jgi:hypothetical protein
MTWLRSACRRCVEWVWSWFGPPRLVVPFDALAPEDPQTVTTRPGARIAVELRIRRETPPGIARLAAILSETARESAIPSRSGLARRPAGSGAEAGHAVRQAERIRPHRGGFAGGGEAVFGS